MPGVTLPMAALIPRVAQVRTESGSVVEASLANLSERGAFLRTGADLRFRELLVLRVLDLELRAQVLFVSEAPAGVVVVFLDPGSATRGVLARHEAEVEVLPGQGVEPADPWTEDTAAGVTDEPHYGLEAAEQTADDLPAQPVKLATDDLEPLREAPPDLDPGLLAAAMIDDGVAGIPILEPIGLASHTEPGLSALDPIMDGPFEDEPQDDLHEARASAARAPSPRPPSSLPPRPPRSAPREISRRRRSRTSSATATRCASSRRPRTPSSSTATSSTAGSWSGPRRSRSGPSACSPW